MNFTLTDVQLVELTHRQRPSAQARVLARLGIPYRFHPTDGGLVVSSAAAEAVLAGNTAASAAAQAGYSVDLEKLRTCSAKAPKSANV